MKWQRQKDLAIGFAERTLGVDELSTYVVSVSRKGNLLVGETGAPVECFTLQKDLPLFDVPAKCLDWDMPFLKKEAQKFLKGEDASKWLLAYALLSLPLNLWLEESGDGLWRWQDREEGETRSCSGGVLFFSHPDDSRHPDTYTTLCINWECQEIEDRRGEIHKALRRFIETLAKGGETNDSRR